MKKIRLLLFAAMALVTVQVNAQTADEIINKNIDAMGGKEKLATLKTVKETGSMSTQGIDIAMTITKSQLTGMRVDIALMGNSYYQFANTTKGMVLMPGMSEAQEMDPETFKSFATQMDIQGSLLNYKDKGTTVELVGSEKVDGADAYNLKVTFKTGKVANFYIDKVSNRLIKISGKAMMQGQEMNVESTLADYKQNADGYWFPYSITNMQGTIVFDKIETNTAIDEKIYTN